MNLYEKMKQTAITLALEPKTQQNVYGLHVLNEAINFLREGSYTDIRHKELILKHLDQPIKEVAAHYGVSEQALAKARYRIVKDYEDRVSPLFVPLKNDRDWKNLEILLYLTKTPNLSEKYVLVPFIREVERLYHQLGQPKIQDYELKECTKELQLLGAFSAYTMLRCFETLDAEGVKKIAYLLLMMDSRMGTPLDRFQLYHLLVYGKKFTRKK